MVTQLNGSVAKAFSILKLFGETRSQIAASDLVRHLGMNGITAHRFLKTLENEGALVQVEKGRYRLGYLLIDLGDRALHEDNLGRTLQPVLDGVTADMQEASMATLYQGGMVICAARATSGRSLSVDVRVGHRLEAYCTAHGKVWLAHLPEPARAAYLGTLEPEKLTARTITDTVALQTEIKRIRAAGYAINDGEREAGISAVAVPVLADSGRMIVGLSVFGPSTRFTSEKKAAALERLKEAVADARSLLYGAGLAG